MRKTSHRALYVSSSPEPFQKKKKIEVANEETGLLTMKAVPACSKQTQKGCYRRKNNKEKNLKKKKN